MRDFNSNGLLNQQKWTIDVFICWVMVSAAIVGEMCRGCYVLHLFVFVWEIAYFVTTGFCEFVPAIVRLMVGRGLRLFECVRCIDESRPQTLTLSFKTWVVAMVEVRGLCAIGVVLCFVHV